MRLEKKESDEKKAIMTEEFKQMALDALRRSDDLPREWAHELFPADEQWTCDSMGNLLHFFYLTFEFHLDIRHLYNIPIHLAKRHSSSIH